MFRDYISNYLEKNKKYWMKLCVSDSKCLVSSMGEYQLEALHYFQTQNGEFFPREDFQYLLPLIVEPSKTKPNYVREIVSGVEIPATLLIVKKDFSDKRCYNDIIGSQKELTFSFAVFKEEGIPSLKDAHWLVKEATKEEIEAYLNIHHKDILTTDIRESLYDAELRKKEILEAEKKERKEKHLARIRAITNFRF